MILDTLTREKSQAQSRTTLDLLIGSDNLSGRHNAFLLAGKVEGLSPATLFYYTWTLKRFIQACNLLGVEKPGDVKAEHVRYFLSTLQATNKPASVHVYYRAVKRFFNWMIAERILDESPVKAVRPPRVPDKVIVPFTDNHIRDMLELCGRGHFIDVRNKAIILTFADSGMRLSELLHARLADLNLEEGCIKVMGKGSKERYVPISKVTTRAIMSYLCRRTDDLPELWLSEERHPLKDPSAIRQMIVKLAKRAGVTGVRASPHTFRHYFGTKTIENGANLYQVKELLGHSTLEMTKKYSKTLDSRKAVEAHHGTAGHKGFSPVDNLYK